MADYCTSDELKAYIGSDSTNFGTLLQAAATSASRAVEGLCDRTFVPETGTSVLYLDPSSAFEVCFNADIYTTSSLTLSTDDGTGSYPTTWTLDTDYVLQPRNQRSGPIVGYPWTGARATGTKVFTSRVYPWGFETVKVVGKIGWAATPDEVKQATLVIGAQIFKMKDAADGFVGVDGWGPTRMRSEFKSALPLLSAYMRAPIAIG